MLRPAFLPHLLAIIFISLASPVFGQRHIKGCSDWDLQRQICVEATLFTNGLITGTVITRSENPTIGCEGGAIAVGSDRTGQTLWAAPIKGKAACGVLDPFCPNSQRDRIEVDIGASEAQRTTSVKLFYEFDEKPFEEHFATAHSGRSNFFGSPNGLTTPEPWTRATYDVTYTYVPDFGMAGGSLIIKTRDAFRVVDKTITTFSLPSKLITFITLLISSSSPMSTPTEMQYVNLGKSGLKVSRVILGTMGFGKKEWEPWVVEERESIDVIKAAFAAGINTFDTANVYSNGHSEIILGKAIKEIGAPRDSFVIMTKVYFAHPGPDRPDVHPIAQGLDLDKNGKHIFTSIKDSLKRLDLEYVDVLQCHRFDPNTPIEETMKALHDVVQAGYARYIGMSSCYAYQFQAMQNYAISHNLTPFISMQNHQSLIYREEEREMNPTCKMLVAATSARGEVDWYGPAMKGNYVESSNEIIRRVEKLAKEKGVSMAQISLAWLLHQDVVAAPIVGMHSVDRVHDIVAQRLGLCWDYTSMSTTDG
ncbi:3869_t:CDS:2 [Acaulospora colombiana]|uniref:3869_t:CDS:1 n=1 Tax=Acaulospora colombiana TaxID=27376 RepID=A0ACA9MFB1_9GLOM|nr:3869_t:CDS:2 [Acaulospora colombiana]